MTYARIFGVFLLLAVWATPSHGQDFGDETRTTSLTTPQLISFYPSYLALGGATVAADGRLGFPDVNPATIGEQGLVAVQVDAGGTPIYSTDWPFEAASEFNVYAPTVTMRQGPWAGAVQLKMVDRGSVELRDPEGNAVLEDGGSEWALDFYGSYERDSGWRFGAGLGLVQVKAPDFTSINPDFDRTSTTLSLDLGVFKSWVFPQETVTFRPTFGASLSNFGPTLEENLLSLSTAGSTIEQAQPMMLRVGGGLRLTSEKTWRGGSVFEAGIYTSLAKELTGGEVTQEAGGVRKIDVYGPFKSLFATWDRAYSGIFGGERVGAWKQIKKQIGVEAKIAQVLLLRAGHQTDTDFTTGLDRSTAIGAGLDFFYVRFDISTEVGSAPFWQNTTIGRITARIPLNGTPNTIWSR